MALSKENIANLAFWMALVLLLIFLAWRVFGSSPNLEQLGFILTLFGVTLSWKSVVSSEKIKDKVKSLSNNFETINQKLDKLDRLEEISNCLQKLVKLQEENSK